MLYINHWKFRENKEQNLKGVLQYETRMQEWLEK